MPRLWYLDFVVKDNFKAGGLLLRLFTIISITLLLTHTGPALAANYSESGGQQPGSPGTLLPAHHLPGNDHALSLEQAPAGSAFEDQAFAGLEGLRRVAAPAPNKNRGGHLGNEPERIPLPLIAHIVTILIGGILFSLSLKTHRKRMGSNNTPG